MRHWPCSADRLRAMYRGGRAGPAARPYARAWAAVFGLGLMPRRWVTLEVAGRRSGRVVRFPLGMAGLDGRRYLVPMLGGQCNWVQNVRAAGGRATLRHGRAVACRLVEVPVSERAPIIKRYLQQVPGARPHIPVDRRAPVAEFEAIAPRYPVFRVIPVRPAPPARPAPVPPAAGAGQGMGSRERRDARRPDRRGRRPLHQAPAVPAPLALPGGVAAAPAPSRCTEPRIR